jgi:exosome complex component RRP41
VVGYKDCCIHVDTKKRPIVTHSVTSKTINTPTHKIQMSRQYVSPAGLRRDGRRPHEIRRLRCRFGPVGDCDGSVYLEHGCNKILAVVRGPRALASRSQGQFDRATVRCTYTQAPFAKTEHRKIRSRDRRTAQIASNITKTFEAVIQTHLYPRSEISIEIQVLQSDGGCVASAMNATTLALFDAGIPCSDYVVSCTAGHLDKRPLLDLNYEEESSGGPMVHIAMAPSTSTIITTEMISKMPVEAFEETLLLAQQGCMQMYELFKTSVKERVLELHTSKHHGGE